MLANLPKRLRPLMSELIYKYQPDLQDVLDSAEKVFLTDSDRLSLRDAAADELLESGTGFLKDEPTPKGLLLEEIIDWLGPEYPHQK